MDRSGWGSDGGAIARGRGVGWDAARSARDALHAFTEARARPGEAADKLGEWTAVLVETVDFDPDDERL